VLGAETRFSWRRAGWRRIVAQDRDSLPLSHGLRRMRLTKTVPGWLLFMGLSLFAPSSSVEAQEAGPGEKSPALALGLSLLVPGAGQFYNGQVLKGAVMLGGAVATSWAIVLTAADVLELDDDTSDTTVHVVGGIGMAIIVWSWIDAPLSARAINRRIRAGDVTLELGPSPQFGGAHGGLSVGVLRAEF
jgi:hypothetical protein